MTLAWSNDEFAQRQMVVIHLLERPGGGSHANGSGLTTQGPPFQVESKNAFFAPSFLMQYLTVVVVWQLSVITRSLWVSS